MFLVLWFALRSKRAATRMHPWSVVIWLCTFVGTLLPPTAVSNVDVTYSEKLNKVGFLHRLAKRDVPESAGDAIDGLQLPWESEWWNNATHKTVDHKYYRVEIYKPEMLKFKDYWISVGDLQSGKGAVKVDVRHSQLSNSYRRAVSQKLRFKFPFYGHLTENVTIATGGFVYVGEYVHNWLAATQYIAPLMANFDTTTSNRSFIQYADTGDMFVVEWNSVVLRSQQEVGNFTFQLSLHKNGDIWFVYKEIPITIVNISDAHHPRKVGLSDAYLFQHIISTLNRRIIYEYHRIEIPFDEIKSGTVVEIKANPVCISFTNCGDCINATLKEFNCSWCNVPESRGGPFCSDEAGLHRRRQDWLFFGCKTPDPKFECPPLSGSSLPADESSTASTVSPMLPQTADITSTTPIVTLPPLVVVPNSSTVITNRELPTAMGDHSPSKMDITHNKRSGGLSSGGVICLLFIGGFVLCLVGWVAYAYNNPQSRSGQLLIRYRPSRWRFGDSRSDIRYTASVHM